MDDFARTDEPLSPTDTYEPPRLRDLGKVDELTTRDGVSVVDAG